MFSSPRNLAVPSARRCLSTVPITPLPAGASKPPTGANSSLRSCAAATIAAASGCSLPRSTLAASCSTWRSSKPASGTTATTFGLPSVSVPVLSTTKVSTNSMRSSASAFLISTPAWAPRPTPTMIDIGVASPSAQGQAMISTLTAATRPKAKRGSGPNVAHDAKAMSAAAITVGTNQPATWSARRWIGARLRCACATICTIRASSVSRPILSARMTKLPDLLSVPPMTWAPSSFVTGMDSPVTMDSSSAERPSSSTPSTGTLSPGRTRNLSPTATASSEISSSLPSSCTRRAVLGARSSSALMAPEVASRARSSSTWPISTSTVIMLAAS